MNTPPKTAKSLQILRIQRMLQVILNIKVSPMKNAQPGRAHSLLSTLTITGASLVGGAGMLIGGVVGSIAVVPVTAAAWGYSLGGWASGVAGLVLGTVANFLPLYRRSAEKLPLEIPSSAAPETRQTVSLSNYAEDIGGFTGGIAGAFTGAALGAVAAGIVTIAETRQAMLRGDHPQEIKPRRKDRDKDNFSL